MKFLISVAVLVTLATMAVALPLEELQPAKLMPLEESNYRQLFTAYQRQHGRSYTNEEFAQRYALFKESMDFVRQHNNNPKAHRVEMNKFSDRTPEEKMAMLGYAGGAKRTPAPGGLHRAKNVKLPSSVDWRQKGVVTPVKNQGQCGSCWSFSTTGSTEGAHAIATGNLVSLSEQNLMDCSTAEGNMGCNGGLMDQAFQYIIKNNGIDTEASYPYKGVDGSCHFKNSTIGATISSYRDVSQGSESDLQNAVATVGPVSVAIDANHPSFMSYSSGVLVVPGCSSTQLDHGVLAVGYGSSNGQDYWLVKNSWGEDWGMNGYVMMARNHNNMCGIATSASYPIV